MGCTCKRQRMFVKLTEHNEWEGETWYYFLEYDGNYSPLAKLEEIINRVDPHNEDMVLDVSVLYPEDEVDILIKHSPQGYMQVFNKVTGYMKDFEEGDVTQTVIGDDDWQVMDLGKGQVSKLFETDGLE